MLKARKKVSVTPYSHLSFIYDFVMNHVNYKKWAKYISQLIDRHGININSIADISCGTGTLDQELKNYGYELWACDYSYNMLKMLKNKLGKQNGIYYWCADMANPVFNKQPDAIISLYDSMNYFLEADQWIECLNKVYSSLKKDGLFIFDISTFHNSLNVFQNFSQREKTNSGSYYRKSRFDRKRAIQTNYFEIKLKDFPDYIFCETHQQRILTLAQVIQFINQTDFHHLGCYNGISFRPGNEYSERVHFVLKK